MIGWIILGSIVGLLVLVLLCPIHVILLYDGKLTLKVGVPLIHVRVLPTLEDDLASPDLSPKQKRRIMKKIMKKKAKAEKKEAKAKKKGKKQKQPLSDSLKKKHTKGVVKDLGRLFRTIRVLAAKFGKKLHIKIKRLEIVAASDDAAKTAYLFGALSQAMAYGLCALDAYTNVTFCNKRVAVRADFCEEKTKVFADLRFRIRVGSVIALLFAALWQFAKESMNDSMGSLSTKEDGSDNIQNQKGISA